MTTNLKTVDRLSWDVSHLGDDDFDAQLVKFEGSENTVCLLPDAEYELPKEILFVANYRTLDKIDFPYNDVSWPIMSKRMLDCLTSAASFNHEVVRLGMIDDRVSSKDRYDREGHLKHEVVRHDFSAIKLPDLLDAFDWEKSIYKTREQFPGAAFQIRKWTLKLPTNGFPPVFRISASPADLFVSGDACLALRKAGITGIELEDVDVST